MTATKNILDMTPDERRRFNAAQEYCQWNAQDIADAKRDIEDMRRESVELAITLREKVGDLARMEAERRRKQSSGEWPADPDPLSGYSASEVDKRTDEIMDAAEKLP